MRRSTRRRFVVALALLSHLMTALFVHVPMAYAGMTDAAAESAASSAPCPEHAKMHHAPDVGQTSDTRKTGDAADPGDDAQPSGAAQPGDHPQISGAVQASDGPRSAPAHAFGTSAVGHDSGCKSGPCKCPCAHAQALAFVPTMAPAIVARAPSASPYRVPLAPDCATSFFRPPI